MHYRLGVLGGMGPQATNTFYQFIIDRTDAHSDQEHVNTLILSDSDMPDRTAAILSGRTERVYRRLLSDARLLEQAGCTVDPNAQYRGSYSAGSPNNDAEDDAVDADFEEV